MSELDKNRRKYLWEKIQDKQVIITCTDIDDIPFAGKQKIFRVKGGCVTEE